MEAVFVHIPADCVGLGIEGEGGLALKQGVGHQLGGGNLPMGHLHVEVLAYELQDGFFAGDLGSHVASSGDPKQPLLATGVGGETDFKIEAHFVELHLVDQL